MVDPPITFRTAVSFWGQSSQISSGLSPNRDCGSKRDKQDPSTGYVRNFLLSTAVVSSTISINSNVVVYRNRLTL